MGTLPDVPPHNRGEAASTAASSTGHFLSPLQFKKTGTTSAVGEVLSEKACCFGRSTAILPHYGVQDEPQIAYTTIHTEMYTHTK